MSETLHKEQLSNICRLCRQKIKLDSSYVKKKSVTDFKDVIRDIFSYNIELDKPDIHPPCICNNCRRKLQMYRSSTTLAFPVDIAEFTGHVKDKCSVCSANAKNKLPKFSFKVEYSGVLKNAATESMLPSLSKLRVDEITENFKFVKTFENNMYSFYSYPTSDEDQVPVMKKSIKLYSDYSWSIYALDKLVAKSNINLSSLPVIVDSGNVETFFKTLSNLKLCPGNNDFKDLVDDKLSFGPEKHFLNKSKQIKAKIENYYFCSIDDLKIIRSVSCEKLVDSEGSRCNACTIVRKDLNVSSYRHEKNFGDKEKKPNVHRNRSELLSKCEEQHQNIRNLRRIISRREKKIEKLYLKESVTLNNDVQTVFTDIMESNVQNFPKDSPKYLLWKEQLKQSKLANKKSMKWHPLMIRWCLSIYLKSPSAYEHLRRSGFLELPHRTTLNQYTGFASSGAGFKPAIVARMADDLKIDTLKDYERQTILMFDEMKIKKDLVYCPNSGEIRGFTELGNINEELNDFDRYFNKNNPKPKDLASHVICLMAAGIMKRFTFPVAYFSTSGFSSDQIFPIVWKAIGILETIGLEVVGVVCDGASPNRRFFKIHRQDCGLNVSDDGVTYWTPSRVDPERKIFFFSDPPHLIKTIRNNIENSGSNKQTRNLMFNGQAIQWKQIEDLYEWDLGINRHSPGIRKLYKLTEDHVTLTPNLRMRVYLAAQVLSKTVADVFAHRNLPYCRETEKFIRNTDIFFDCLNVSKLQQGTRNRKDALHPYRSANDWRLQWLKETYLGSINQWKDEADATDGLTKAMKAKLCLSSQTIAGIRITVHSFVELIPTLLNKFSGVNNDLYILSGKLNQDAVEEHFGRVRMRGGANENPTVHEYGLQNRKIIVVKADMLQVMRGNTRGRVRENVAIDVNDQRLLPKRPKK